MRESLKGVQPSPLTAGVWRGGPSLAPAVRPQQDIPVAAATPAAPAQAPNMPMQIGRAQPAVAQPAPIVRTQAPPPQQRVESTADLLPPGSIPQGTGQRRGTAPPPPRDQRNFFDKLFGG